MIVGGRLAARMSHYFWAGWMGRHCDGSCCAGCRNLHDVFINIRDDEGDHVRTMRACQVRASHCTGCGCFLVTCTWHH